MVRKKSPMEKVKCAVRKFFSARVIPHMVLNGSRIFFYRLCGYKIGKNCFIGMRCYLDDLEPTMLTIGDHVTISYGVFFACHGRRQEHYPITIEDDAYIGMHATIISKNANGTTDGITIGKGAIVGAGAVVNRDIPAGATAVGNPVRILSEKADRDE